MSLVKLGIAADYPVEWEFEQILRDLIQNFFDSIGYENFGKEFIYHYEKDDLNEKYTITMKTQNHPFSYKWLTYIGGSTKTDSPGNFIGQYGEGFKMCMLCLKRLGISNITMHSQNWIIRPCIYTEKIEDKDVQMLGYECDTAVDDGETVLIINDVDIKYEREISEGLLHFFYPENPLFGKKIAETDRYAIYERSEMRIPCQQYITDFKGILYCNFLARGRISFPVNILFRGDLRNFDTRKRKNLTDIEVWEILYEIAKLFDAELSYKFLVRMRSYWNDIPRGERNWRTWYYLVCQLVRNVSKSKEHVEKFKAEYSNLAYIERMSSDKRRNSIIKETEYWAKEVNSKELVNPIFRLLGAESLVEKYLLSKETTYVKPTEIQQKRIDLLFNTISKVIPFKLYDERPEVVIDISGNKNQEPLQFSNRNFSRKRGERLRKYKLYKVVLQEEDLEKDAFFDTFVKFADILLHTYGTSRSNTMNILLTHMGEFIICCHQVIEDAEKMWAVGI